MLQQFENIWISPQQTLPSIDCLNTKTPAQFKANPVKSSQLKASQLLVNQLNSCSLKDRQLRASQLVSELLIFKS